MLTSADTNLAIGQHGSKRKIVREQRNKSGDTGSRKGNPDPRTPTRELRRRPATELAPVETSSGSVRNDRSNKSRSPRSNATSATRASGHPTPRAKSICDAAQGRRLLIEAVAVLRLSRAARRTSSQGPGKRSRIRQTSDPCRPGSRLRHEDVQSYPMGSGRAYTQSRNPGPRSGNVGSDRTREASGPTSPKHGNA